MMEPTTQVLKAIANCAGGRRRYRLDTVRFCGNTISASGSLLLVVATMADPIEGADEAFYVPSRALHDLPDWGDVMLEHNNDQLLIIPWTDSAPHARLSVPTQRDLDYPNIDELTPEWTPKAGGFGPGLGLRSSMLRQLSDLAAAVRPDCYVVFSPHGRYSLHYWVCYGNGQTTGVRGCMSATAVNEDSWGQNEEGSP